jgi:hypothetical protein
VGRNTPAARTRTSASHGLKYRHGSARCLVISACRLRTNGRAVRVGSRIARGG